MTIVIGLAVVRSTLKYCTAYRQEEGVLVRQVSGEVMPLPEEKGYFRLAGVPWIAPERRTTDALRHVQTR